jgi:hypothetical protein
MRRRGPGNPLAHTTRGLWTEYDAHPPVSAIHAARRTRKRHRGLTAAEMHGLAGWQRPAVTVLIGESVDVEPIPGVQFVKTRRDIVGFRSTHWSLPTWQVEPAVLLFAGCTRSSRTAVGSSRPASSRA